jgi:hypothetical protein
VTEHLDGLPPSSIEFWLEEARLLKKAAETSWATELGASTPMKLIYGPRHDQALEEVTEGLGAELKLLYRYLISLAIQYLAIGILIEREPDFLLRQRPGHHIVSLVEECEVVPTPQQRHLLHDIEQAYGWSERYPAGGLLDSHDELRSLTGQLSGMGSLSGEEKASLDALYDTLYALADR